MKSDLTKRTMLGAVAVVAVAAAGWGVASEGFAESDAATVSRLERFDGAPIRVGDGFGRAYVVTEGADVVEIGVALDEEALRSLPAGKWHEGDVHRMTEHLMPLPAAARSTPFRLIEVDWNPGGHEPEGVYNLPHFDFHFYTITLAERNAIDLHDPEFQEKAVTYPAAEYLPKGYISPTPVLAVPRMGTHWIDPTSPELHGKTFDRTFLYGTWNGELIFMEPMITRDFLWTRPNLEVPVSTPDRFETSGPWPSVYSVRYDADRGEYRVALTGFVTTK